MFVLPARRLVEGVEPGEEGDFILHVAPQPLPKNRQNKERLRKDVAKKGRKANKVGSGAMRLVHEPRTMAWPLLCETAQPL
jgi:hypothetical protein